MKNGRGLAGWRQPKRSRHSGVGAGVNIQAKDETSPPRIARRAGILSEVAGVIIYASIIKIVILTEPALLSAAANMGVQFVSTFEIPFSYSR